MSDVVQICLIFHPPQLHLKTTQKKPTGKSRRLVWGVLGAVQLRWQNEQGTIVVLDAENRAENQNWYDIPTVPWQTKRSQTLKVFYF